MFITELAEPQLLVIYPGRFQPFHKGHYAVYNYLTGRFGRDNVLIATSNKVEEPKSPFSFAEKAYFMQLTGVPADRIVQATNPYQIESILATSNLHIANPENTVVIFAVSEKDMAEDPRFSFKTKKDGSAPYFQPLKDINDTESMKQHGYIMTVPTFDFNVNNQPMRSASELRASYAKADPEQRQAIVKDLFGRYTREAEQIMNSKIPAEQAHPVAETFNRGGNNPLRDRNDYYQKLDYLQKQLMDPALRDMRDQINDRIGQLQKAARIAGFINETMEEGKVTRTTTGLKHRATKGYGADYDSGQGVEFAKQKHHSELNKVNKTLTKSLEKGMDVNFKEGWSDKRNPTPYGVYVNGRQWKEFKTDDHARAVAKKLQARLKAEGRNDKVTIAPAEGWLKENEISVTGMPVKNEKGYYSIWIRKSGTDQWIPVVKYSDKSEADQTVAELQSQGHEVIIRECAGTGVIASKKQAKDPRYSTSLTKDVRPGQIQKNLKAFNLAEGDREPYQQAIDKLQDRLINNWQEDIAWWEKQIASVKDPVLQASYRKKIEALKDKIRSHWGK